MAAVAWEHPTAGARHVRLPTRAGVRRVAAGVGVAVVVGFVGMASGGAPAPLRSDPAADDTPPATVVIGADDTLWSVVAAHAPSGVDPMAYAVEVAAYNNLDPLSVPAGTVVRLPPVRP